VNLALTPRAALVPAQRPSATPADRVWSLLQEQFLAGAGWDRAREVLAPPAGHPQLGYHPCAVDGCTIEAMTYGGLCQTCDRRRRASGLAVEVFIATGPQRLHVRGEAGPCRVSCCERPCSTSRSGLCIAHDRQRARLHVTTSAFIARAEVVGLAGFGQCAVVDCQRACRGRLALCHAHEASWSKARRAGGDFAVWCRTTGPIASGHEVVLRGLPSLVQAQILFGLQERCQLDTSTPMFVLRCLQRRLRVGGHTSLLELDTAGLPSHHRGPVEDLQRAVACMSGSPEEEQARDVWNMGVFGYGRKRLDFTVIFQRWLREAAKHWVAEELPLRRGEHAVDILREHVRSLAALADSLRTHRTDQGVHPAMLGRADIVTFLNQLAHQEHTGQISPYHRHKTCQHAAMVLRECRALGMTRPGNPMAGLADEFTFRRTDSPPVATDEHPGRALPDHVLATLTASLDGLQAMAGSGVRTAIRLLIDTGRRPTEICRLTWDCLDHGPDGNDTLVYTDFKNNRLGRRLPIAEATTEVIREQQRYVRERFPDAPVAALTLIPRVTRNPLGRRPISLSTLTDVHRRWVDALPALPGSDGLEFDRTAIFLYAYRHSYAQRHADAGTPVDVLRELMGHRSIATTQGYYKITATRTRRAVDTLAALQFDGHGQPAWTQARHLLEHEHQQLALGHVAVPCGTCTEPSNVKAAAAACPLRFRCLGCGHFRSDPSYLPELRDYLDTLLSDRERLRAATDVEEWARLQAMPSDTEITRLRQLIRRVEDDLNTLDPRDRQDIDDAIQVVRHVRRTVHLGVPTIPPPDTDPGLAAERS
jgi:integrase